MPYNHSNIDSDEVMYYVDRKYTARKGIEEGSITSHPQGFPHLVKIDGAACADTLPNIR